MQKLTDLVYPDCSLCRTLRASMAAGLAVVLLTYAAQLLTINIEMRGKRQEGVL